MENFYEFDDGEAVPVGYASWCEKHGSGHHDVYRTVEELIEVLESLPDD